MSNEWFYTTNGQQAAAPVSNSQLRQMAASGQLQPTDLVWQEGLPNWMPASTIKGLFAGPAIGEQPIASESPSMVQSRARKKAEARPAEGKPVAAVVREPENPGGLLEMHPVLVFFLSVITVTLFGWIYALAVFSHYHSQFTRTVDSSNRPLGKGLHPLFVMMLSYITFGFYGVYRNYKIMKECLQYLGRSDLNPRIELTLMLCIPLYSIYVQVFRLPELIRAVQSKAKLPESSGLFGYLFVIPFMLPMLPVLSMTQQESMNQIWIEAP
jgi:hypothetical protein